MSWVRKGAAALGASVAALAMAVASPGVADAGLTGGPHTDGTIVSTFAPGSFPESVALASGHAYVSLGFAGQIQRVTDGSTTTVATVNLEGNSLLTGVAVAGDMLYFARASFEGAGWLYRVPLNAVNASPSPVATFEGSFPNGLVVHDRLLYISDSMGGRVFALDPSNDTVRTWCQAAVLTGGKALGINGIAFQNNTLYAVVAATGDVVTIQGGSRPEDCIVTPVVRSKQLVTGDGIVFGPDGLLYVTVNQFNKLATVNLTTGQVQTIAGRTEGLSYPTQMVFDGDTMYLTNGALANGAATLMRWAWD